MLRMTESRKFTLDFTEGGILREDNFFEVVFNPGSDKREKRIVHPSEQFRRSSRILGQIF
jgi:hypothetical protein